MIPKQNLQRTLFAVPELRLIAKRTDKGYITGYGVERVKGIITDLDSGKQQKISTFQMIIHSGSPTAKRQAEEQISRLKGLYELIGRNKKVRLSIQCSKDGPGSYRV